ncbi:MAG: ion transporter [Alphaproteobacteria bacterium]|nr:ion transporter [Alphaproteobacteria bacterium]
MLHLIQTIRKKADTFLNSNLMHWIDTGLLFINLGVVALENRLSVQGHDFILLQKALHIFVIIFIAEAAIRILVNGRQFFADHRNYFTLVVLGSCVYFNRPALTILLAFRSLRAWRTLAFIPKTRHVIDALYHAIPGVVNIIFLIVFVFTIFTILGVYLFGSQVPDLWGDYSQSFTTLQQIMLSDDWGDNLRATSKFYPHSWIFFLSFLTLITFVLLNLFIGVIVDAMQTAQEEKEAIKRNEFEDAHKENLHKMHLHMKQMQKELIAIKQALTK